MIIRKFLIGVGFLAVLVAVSLLGWTHYREAAAHRQNEAKLQTIRRLSEEGEPRLALRLLTQNPPNFATDAMKQAWLEEEIQLAARLRDLERIEFWGSFAEDTVLALEEPSILWARLLLTQRKYARVESIVEAWMHRSEAPETWFVLKVDGLILQGEAERARALLNSRSFAGEGDIPRLLRLFILDQEQPEARLDHLETAFEMNPRHADIRSFLGQLWESQGNVRLASREYVAAYLCDPANPIYQNQLFDFYLRRGKIHLAVDMARACPSKGLVDNLWLKHLFYSRVATGLPKALPLLLIQGQALEGPRFLRPDTDDFWIPDDQETAFSTGSRFNQRPEIAWLLLLQALKAGEYAEARQHLRVQTHRQRALAPNLADALLRILEGHANPDRRQPFPVRERSTRPPGTHPFFAALLYEGSLGGLPSSAPVQRRVAAALLAEGWMEAALTFDSMSPPAGRDALPDWYAYGITQALRYNRGMSEAAAYAEAYLHFPLIRVLQGELEIGRGNIERAISLLRPVAPERARAASLLTGLYAALGRNDLLQAYLKADASFAQSPEGSAMQSLLNKREKGVALQP